MTVIRSTCAAILLVSSVALGGAFAASKEDKAKLEEAMSYDGLEQIKVKGIDIAYARPGATLAGYTKVQIDQIEVAFHKNWDPNRTGSMFKLSADERENIRSGVAKLVHEELVKALQNKKSTYEVVDTAGPDVLRMKAHIINLYVNAPDTLTAGRTRTYTTSAGEMTLVAELYDSESGQVLARIIDRREAQNTGMMMLSNSVVNASEARDIAAAWGRILKDRLDKAHGIGKK
jgi:hypothetical protein